MEDAKIPGIFVASMEGGHAYERRMVRDRFNADGTSDLHDADDGHWTGEMGDIHLRTLRIVTAAFEMGVLACALRQVEGHENIVNEDREMIDKWVEARRKELKK
jgi:hypothetical protein